jgi:cation diffusion facilitator CzcD-associated flavoprotein CzcO
MTDRYDACIVGAGISGLNALFVASRYLSRDQRVILVDRRSRAGGMWLDTYDYVRLHQPHPFFTAGNIEWTLGKEREHLATKDEVLDHLRHCLEVIKRRIRVTELFGYEFESCRGGRRDGAHHLPLREGRAIEIEADRLIKAYGQGSKRMRRSSCRAHAPARSHRITSTCGGRRCGPATHQCGSSAAGRPAWTRPTR